MSTLCQEVPNFVQRPGTDTTPTSHYISKCNVVSHHERSNVVWLWCQCGVAGLWTKIGTCGPPMQHCADLVLGDGSSAVGLRCVPRNHHELCGRLHDSHVARRRRLVWSQQSDCITSTSSNNNRYDNYGCQSSAILHTQNFETKKMSETNDKKCSLQLTAITAQSIVAPRHFYRTMLCTRGTSHGPVSVSQSVSVTSRCSTKTAKRRIT